MRRLRVIVPLVAALVVAGGLALASFPSMAACRASGRLVDPTERHCVLADGSGAFVQLREHVLFHTVHVLTLLAAAALLVLIVTWLRRAIARTARADAS